MRGILNLTSTMGQVLKQFIGIYSQPLPDCDGLTVEEWMGAHGVHRFVSKSGKKGNYTPALLMEGWHDQMKSCNAEGKVMGCKVFRNVPAKVVVDDINDPKGTAFRVFTKEEAQKIDGKPISRYMLVDIPQNKWSVNIMLRGLKQSRDFSKESAKMALSDAEWKAIDHVYVVKYVQDANGITRKIIPVKKSKVLF